MRLLVKLLKGALVVLLVAVAALAGWLYLAPPDLIRVGTGYTAKIVCSNVFIAGRDPQEVLAVDVQAPGHPLLGFIDIDVDREREVVSAALLGLFGRNQAVHREGLGCASVPVGEIERVPAVGAAAHVEPVERDAAAPWPEGEGVADADPAVAAILDDAEMVGPGMRAVVVVRDGRIVGERYGEGFSANTPLLGWSMTKTVTAAILGTLDDRLPRDAASLRPGWSDARSMITVADLMAMSSGLEFNEDYGAVADVTRMLYLESDMAGFAADNPLLYPHGTEFSYSSGTSVILSRLWQDRFDDQQQALSWPRRALFAPLGMESAVLETDAAGTFVGSSYLYATARDWARFGQFLLQGGEWDGTRILPAGYVDWMREPAPASGGTYGRGQLWLAGPERGRQAELPDDTYWLRGHDGQSMAIVPSSRLIVLRLGLTPSSLDYSPAPMIAALVAAGE
ncbi:serine hydrolase [Aliihoeflea sp. 40Bstr573]|uniref:serine hydrolase domain-containing protein n=1 Tax=Aliihoeflea sp. 40Bstr573 TaxID=2696467 RepID=UPI002095CA06|nr:serine hydrolase [Aliihoeflea sp. 40Bstr573]MCO6388050.1 serine hydrolase [Aliihoeflea sp. 40Bstr573]